MVLSLGKIVMTMMLLYGIQTVQVQPVQALLVKPSWMMDIVWGMERTG